MAIDTVLVAVGQEDEDRAKRLGEAAIDLAGPTGAHVVLAHVFTQQEYDDVVDRLDFDAGDRPESSEVAGRHVETRTIAQALDAADVDYEIRGAVGDRGDAIVELAEDVGADRVIVGGRRRTPAGKAVFGSTAQKIMLSGPCPVTFVQY
jgi:nucleotide-binding universal stress UspA family protein